MHKIYADTHKKAEWKTLNALSSFKEKSNKLPNYMAIALLHVQAVSRIYFFIKTLISEHMLKRKTA